VIVTVRLVSAATCVSGPAKGNSAELAAVHLEAAQIVHSLRDA
jgi:hypothetical protein